MSTATAAPSAAPAAEKGKKSRKKLLIMIVLALVVLGGGGFAAKTFLLGGGSGAAAPDPTTVEGGVETLDPITLNLADGRYLKVTIALQLSEAATLAAGSVDAAAATGPAVDGAKALDATISVLGQRTYDQLIAKGGREDAQKALTARVKALYKGEVLGVYFTDFLMQ